MPESSRSVCAVYQKKTKMSKKIVLKVALDGEKGKRRVMKAVAGTEGVDSLEVHAKEEKITVIGDADPVILTNKLRKLGRTELVSVGPAKEPEKKEAAKKDEKKDEKKAEKKEEKKAEPAKANPEANVTYMYVPNSCDRCSGHTLAFSHENPNACCIL